MLLSDPVVLLFNHYWNGNKSISSQYHSFTEGLHCADNMQKNSGIFSAFSASMSRIPDCTDTYIVVEGIFIEHSYKKVCREHAYNFLLKYILLLRHQSSIIFANMSSVTSRICMYITRQIYTFMCVWAFPCVDMCKHSVSSCYTQHGTLQVI